MAPAQWAWIVATMVVGGWASSPQDASSRAIRVIARMAVIRRVVLVWFFNSETPC